MQVFRHPNVLATISDLRVAYERAVARRERVEALLAVARLETAWTDSSYPDSEGAEGGCRLLLAVVVAVAEGRLVPLPQLPEDALVMQAPEVEGFRFYGLRPEAYQDAAKTWRRENPGVEAWVIGLRTAGTALGAAVAAQLGGATQFVTLRPRGAPDDRRPQLGADLASRMAAWPGHFLIVDEGPGLSGSSFGGMVRRLQELGVEAKRIALLTGWSGDEARLGNKYASRHWADWKKYPASPVEAPVVGALAIDGGAWRKALGRHRSAAVWSAHERPKFLDAKAGVVYKFAGLGRHGHAVADRARQLEAAGLSAPVVEAGDGWIGYRRLTIASPRKGKEWAEFAGRYLAWVGHNFSNAGVDLPSPCLRQMAEENVRELGFEWEAEASAGPTVGVDGRMGAEEWGRTETGWVKFDATDHGDDPFFPGPADSAWDLAAIGVEFGPGLGAAVRREYERWSGDHGNALEARMQWHEVAYLAFRTGFSRLASEQTGAPEAARWRRKAAHYERQLAATLAARHRRRWQAHRGQ